MRVPVASLPERGESPPGSPRATVASSEGHRIEHEIATRRRRQQRRRTMAAAVAAVAEAVAVAAAGRGGGSSGAGGGGWARDSAELTRPTGRFRE